MISGLLFKIATVPLFTDEGAQYQIAPSTILSGS